MEGLRSQGHISLLSDEEVFNPKGINEARENHDASFFLDIAKKIYQNCDDRGSIGQMLKHLGTAWDLRSGRIQIADRLFSSPPELSMHGRDWIYVPREIDSNPSLLIEYFPHLDPAIFAPSQLHDEPQAADYNFRILSGGYPETSLKPDHAYRSRNATLATYIIANETRLALTGHPIDPSGETVSLLTGSRNHNGENILVRYDLDGSLQILNRAEVIASGIPVLIQKIRTDESYDWPKENDIFTPPSPLVASPQ